MRSVHISTRPAVSRRTFLKSSGITLALPMLEAMLPTFAWAKSASATEAPRRFVGMMTNQGILPEFIFPKTAGRDFEETPYLSHLKNHRDQLTVLSGVSLPGVDGGHAAEKSFLTGAPGASRGSFKNSVSLDQVMAEHIGGDTRFPSLVLMVGSDRLSLSWTRSGSMIPPVTSPVALYQSLFGAETPEDRAAAITRLTADRSLLDRLRQQASALSRTLSATDRERLDQYFTAIRDLEKRLAASQSWLAKPKPTVTAAAPREISSNDNLPENLSSMLGLVKLALETDSTRIVTVCTSLASVTPKAIPGVKSNTHELTHHGGREETIAELRKIEEAQFAALGTFADSLKASAEGEQTLLDRTSLLFGTNMGSANSHSNDNLPVVLLGGGFQHAGHLAHNREKNTNLANLYVSLLQRMAIPTDRFASATTTLTGLEFA